MFIWDAKPPIYRHGREKRGAMYHEELKIRAALLLRLGLEPPAIRARLHKLVAWEFDLQPPPAHARDIDQIVDEVCKRNQH